MALAVARAMLTAGQKAAFARDGYLVLEDGIDDDAIAAARDRIWDAVPDDPDDPESLVGVGSRSPDVPTEEPFATINDLLHEYGAALVGDALVAPDGPGMQLALRYPREVRLSATHDRTPTGHLDGYGPGFREHGEYTGFTVGAVVYFDRVDPSGGGFTVWPGSHRVAAEYFSDHALTSPGHGGRLPAVDDDGGWDADRFFHQQARSRMLAGDAGTVILWHNKLVHAAGVNQRSRVRMAGIKRFRRDDHEEIKADAADEPFAYWRGVDGIEPADRPPR